MLAEKMTEVILAIFRANGQVIAWGDRFSEPFELTSARWQMLGALDIAGKPQTAPQLAASMGVTRQGAQKQLDLLLADGAVRKNANPAHQRSPLYQLTEKGQQVCWKIKALWDVHVADLSRHFSEEEITVAHRVLSRIATLHTESPDPAQIPEITHD